MKKVGLDMMLGRGSRCHYKKKIPKTIIVRARLPAGEATKAPPFGSTLGLYGVKAEDFCNFFNKDSLNYWEKGTVVSVLILISPSKTYIVEYKLPTVYAMLNSYFDVNSKDSILSSRNLRKYTLEEEEEGEEVEEEIDEVIFSGKGVIRSKKKRRITTKMLSMFNDKLEGYLDLRLEFWRPIYQIAVIKSQQTNPKILQQWVMQIMGTFHSCNFQKPLRTVKKNYNLRGRRRK